MQSGMAGSPAAARSLSRRLATLAAVAAGAAVACGAVAATTPWSAGVVPTPDELRRLVAVAGAWGLGAGVVAAALAGASRRRAAAALATGLPAAVAVTLAAWPRTGRVFVEVADPVVGGVLVAGVGLALLGRGRAAAPAAALAWGLVVGGAALLRPAAVPPSALGPDLVVITLDTTRADVLQLGRGGDADRTPTLAGLARRGRAFSQAYSPVGLTGPAHAALWSGGVDVLDEVKINGEAVPADTPWLPARLQAAGWQTMAATSAAVLDASMGFCRGFSACDTTAEERLVRGSPLVSWRGWRSRAGMAWSRPDAQTVDRALAMWADRGAGPAALWVHLYGAHWPYRPSSAARRAEGLDPQAALANTGLPGLGDGDWSAPDLELGRALYGAQMRDLDRQVARVIEAAGPTAVVVVVGDHGEEMGEHGAPFTHGRLPFAGTSRVPLVIAGPGVAPGMDARVVGIEQVSEAVEGLLGLGPPGALMAATGAARPKVSRTWGRSQPGGAHNLGPLAGVAVRGPTRSVVATRWHALAAYDRATDPLEVRPLPVQPGDAPLVKALRDAVQGAPEAGSPDPALEAALQALGYQTPDLSPAGGDPPPGR